jgi:Zn finger protein HypA/HybF involved in hydrogenase expression
MDNKEGNNREKNKEKKISFCVEYIYPEGMPDEVVLDRFAQQILEDAATVNGDDIHIVEEGECTIRCPKCGGELRKIGRETVARITGITEYDTYCDKCNITVSIDDRSTFEQEGKILITFA